MKRLHLLLYMILVCLGLQAQEAEQGEQLLVFRNTGVVDLLYTNEVDSILTNDSAQVFYAKDTILVVPFTELDSVAVGNRNMRILNAAVRELTNERDLPWLIRVEGNHLFYSLNTPNYYLPKVGDKLFYGNSHELLPIGLSAKVMTVTKLDTEFDVEIEPVELNEIFDRFFYSGRVNMNELPTGSRMAMANRAHHESKVIPIEGKLDVIDYGEVNASCQLDLVGDFVVDVFNHFYHAHIKGEFSGEVGAKLSCDANTECHPTIPLLYLPLPTVAGVLFPSVYVNLFTDFNAEMNLNFSARRVYRFEYDWLRIDGEQFGKVIPPTEGPAEDEEVKTDLTLDGELHMGVQAGLGLNLIGNRVGFRFDAKLGPCLEGELGIGILGKMRSYNSELWHRAELSTSVKLKFQLSYLRHEIFYVFGNEVVEPITTQDFSLFNDTHYLFPQYSHSNAVATERMNAAAEQQRQLEVNIATAVEIPTETDIETGFEIVDSQDEVVDSVFVGTIEAKQEDATVAQTFDTEIILPSTIKQENIENYTMRPIFHYAGYTISAAPVGISKDVLLQPYSSTQSNGAMTFISSGPFIGSAVKDSTLYQVGMYLPVPLKNNIYRQGKDKKINLSIPIDDNHGNLLIGTWTGKVNDTDVTLTFTEDGTGEYNNRGFVYSMNEPQSGELLLEFENKETMILRVLSVTETELKLKDKRDKSETIWLLTK